MSSEHSPDLYQRPVAAVDWWFLASPRKQYPVIQLAVEGVGLLSHSDLSDAVAEASRACPGTRLVFRKGMWRDSGRAPAVIVGDGAAYDRVRFDSPLLRRPLRPGAGGATCEVLLLTGEPNTVVFRGFHAAMDGRGLLLWATEVFHALAGVPVVGADDRLSEDGLMEKLAGELPDGLPPVAAAPVLQWPSPLGRLGKGRREPMWRRRTVDGSHPGITAKLALALSADGRGPVEEDPALKGYFMVPVDGRRHVPGIRSTSSVTMSASLEVRDGDHWEDVGARLLTALSERQELASRTDPALRKLPRWLVGLLERGADAKTTDKGLYGSTAILSDLGALDLAEFSPPGFTATSVYMLASPGPVAPPEVDAVTADGRTEITVGWWDNPGAAERAEALLDRVEEALSPRAHREWSGNMTQRPVPIGPSVVRLFREQAERTPDRVALSGSAGDLTYAELSRRADAVAAELSRRGIGRGSVVGLLADRSAEMMAGLWGVLRAGAAYLPMDAEHPDARLSGLLTDATAKLCLVQRPYQERQWCPPGCETLVLEELLESADGEAPAYRDAEVRPDDLAYVIYTSGSTGRPKGVQIEHGALLNYVGWATREFEIDADSRLPLITSPSFDVTGTSVYLPLLAGGTVVLMRDKPNHLSLRQLLEESGANSLSLTPAHLDLIGRLELSPAGFRTVVVVGEQLRVPVAARAQEMFGPDCRIINLYGPTEATIGLTVHTYDPERDGAAAAVPIGLPTDNSTVVLLDQDRRFVAPGEVGEMYLGGSQLARGYLGRPDLDRERFVRLADGSRMYRTGDLARVSASGVLEFIGRIDDQVKISGHRVEPAEAARALEEHPAVARAVVVATALPGGHGKSLAGYVVTRTPVGRDELREFLVRRLPEYLVPATLTVLPELPLTVAGKIDVRALPDPHTDSGGAAGQAGSDAPVLDVVESAIADIWALALRVDRSRLTPAQSFHHLGGDSLTLYAVLAQVCRDVVEPGREKTFMARLPEILRKPTLEHVAALVRETAQD
ncbi:amino acid adenylation domain-containing protein [Streptomyces sp. yr375]|uniref:non-ribosomal peptide synthetase n=1 Tax=Streptomyces sp. yr375 TaxID=1761906 RepID=UPI0008B46413|nr:non-ribosomal peptide synthetase [Streptomyces sp. yr375]SES40860.1 amino acid adenylation domain-containing protein [Streptomyces sp. yr375]